MKTYLISSKNVVYNQIRLDYYLTEDIFEEENIKAYGVEVRKTIIGPFGLETTQKCTIGDICTDKNEMCDFIKNLCDNEVFPANVKDIITDGLEENMFLN